MESSNRKSCIIVPVRDRHTHLRVFLLYMNKYFPYLRIIISEQVDTGCWNKGLLFNAAFKEAGYEYTDLILSDVDFIPAQSVDYSPCDIPTLLSTECSQFNYTHCYDRFFGGVVGMTREHYELINGFSNQFRGYGGEDDLLYNSFLQKGIVPAKRLGNRFENFQHPKPDIRQGTQFYQSADYQHNLKLCTSPRDFSEGLSTAQYKVISKAFHNECIYLRINTEQ